MKGDSLGQLILGMNRVPRLGGSCAPSRHANSGAEGALFLNIEQGTARSTSRVCLFRVKKHEH
jgi:hypothetical protein